MADQMPETPDAHSPDSNPVPQLSQTTNPHDEHKNSGKYPQYVMRPLKAIKTVFLFVVGWLDTNDGAVTAVATLVIAALTFFYVLYARAQWHVMDRQLTEMRSSGKQTDQLIYLYQKQVEQLHMQLESFRKVEGAYIGTGQPQGGIASNEVAIALENYGRIPSPRVWIYPHIYRFTSKDHQIIYTKDYTYGGDQTEVPPGTGRYGVRLPLELKEGEAERLQTGSEIMWLAVSFKYDDGFGNVSDMKGTCFVYNPKHPAVWDACPTSDFSHLPK